MVAMTSSSSIMASLTSIRADCSSSLGGLGGNVFEQRIEVFTGVGEASDDFVATHIGVFDHVSSPE